jgi:hypothetical protein
MLLTTVLSVDGIIPNLVVSATSVPLLASTWVVTLIFSWNGESFRADRFTHNGEKKIAATN